MKVPFSLCSLINKMEDLSDSAPVTEQSLDPGWTSVNLCLVRPELQMFPPIMKPNLPIAVITRVTWRAQYDGDHLGLERLRSDRMLVSSLTDLACAWPGALSCCPGGGSDRRRRRAGRGESSPGVALRWKKTRWVWVWWEWDLNFCNCGTIISISSLFTTSSSMC